MRGDKQHRFRRLWSETFPASFVMHICFILLVESPESLTNNFTGIRDRNECSGLRIMYKVSQLHGLTSFQYGQDNSAVAVGVSTLCVVYGGASVQVFHDKITDRLRICTDDREVFTQVDVLDNAVDDEGLCHQTTEGEQTGLRAEDEAGSDGDEQIHDKQGSTDVDTGIFLEDHRQNVGAAAGCADVKQDRSADCRQDDGKDQLQHRLCRQRMLHREPDFCKAQTNRGQNADIDGADTEAAAEKEKSQHQQYHVDDEGVSTCGERTDLAEDDGDTGNATEGKIIRELEDIDTNDQKEGGECQNHIVNEGVENFIFHPMIPLLFCDSGNTVFSAHKYKLHF